MKMLSALALTAILGTSVAFAADTATDTATPPAKAAHSTHHMASNSCSHQAHEKHLKGADRKAFMKTCAADAKAKAKS